MNSFLRQLEITFRRDPENARPRINKKDSVKVNSMSIYSSENKFAFFLLFNRIRNKNRPVIISSLNNLCQGHIISIIIIAVILLLSIRLHQEKTYNLANKIDFSFLRLLLLLLLLTW